MFYIGVVIVSFRSSALRFRSYVAEEWLAISIPLFYLPIREAERIERERVRE